MQNHLTLVDAIYKLITFLYNVFQVWIEFYADSQFSRRSLVHRISLGGFSYVDIYTKTVSIFRGQEGIK